MKHVITTTVLLMSTAMASAQFRISENGNVGIQTFNPQSVLTVNDVGDAKTTVAFRSTLDKCLSLDGGRTGMSVTNSGTGILIQQNYNTNSSCRGISISPLTGKSMADTYGILGYSGVSGADNYGLVGCYFNMTTGLGKNGAGVYGSSTIQTGFEYPGIYAGYFKGNARVTGNLYAKVLSPALASTSASTNNAVETYNTGNQDDVLELLSQLDILKQENVHLKVQSTSTDETNSQSNLLLFDPKDTLTLANLDKMVEMSKDVMVKPCVSTYSVAADQLKEIFPELVEVDEEGNYSIDYAGMVPLLLQSIKELKARFENGMISTRTISKRSMQTTGLEDLVSETAVLEQNNPNPFKDKTVIRFNLPEKVLTAYLYLYDMTGKQIEKIRINERGLGSVTIQGASLSAGMYLYSLIADGEEVATKRMILTK